MVYFKDKSKPRHLMKLMLLPFYVGTVVFYALGAIWSSYAFVNDDWMIFIIMMGVSIAFFLTGITLQIIWSREVVEEEAKILSQKYDYSIMPLQKKSNYKSEHGHFFSFRKEGLRIMEKLNHKTFLANYENVKIEAVRLNPLTSKHPVTFLKITLTEYETVLMNNKLYGGNKSAIALSTTFMDLIDFTSELYTTLVEKNIVVQNMQLIKEDFEKETITNKKVRFGERKHPILKAIGIVALYLFLIVDIIVFSDKEFGLKIAVLVGIPLAIIVFFTVWDLIVNGRVYFGTEGYSNCPFFYIPYSDIKEVNIEAKHIVVRSTNIENRFLYTSSIFKSLFSKLNNNVFSVGSEFLPKTSRQRKLAKKLGRPDTGKKLEQFSKLAMDYDVTDDPLKISNSYENDVKKGYSIAKTEEDNVFENIKDLYTDEDIFGETKDKTEYDADSKQGQKQVKTIPLGDSVVIADRKDTEENKQEK